MKRVVDNFVKSSFKLFGKTIADDKKQAMINLTKDFYIKIQKKTRDPKIKYQKEATTAEKKKKTNETTGMSCEKAI